LLTPADPVPATATTLALKEWGAVALALLEGRQTVLLRKGGIHEKRFEVGDHRFVLFPTVAHSHLERVRPEHRDLVQRGMADVDAEGGAFTVRCGLSVIDVVTMTRPDRLAAIEDLHIWTADSVRQDRLDFRPKQALQVLVVRAVALPHVARLPRLEEYGGCKSWVDLPVAWDGEGRVACDDGRLAEDARRVRAEVS